MSDAVLIGVVGSLSAIGGVLVTNVYHYFAEAKRREEEDRRRFHDQALGTAIRFSTQARALTAKVLMGFSPSQEDIFALRESELTVEFLGSPEMQRASARIMVDINLLGAIDSPVDPDIRDKFKLAIGQHISDLVIVTRASLNLPPGGIGWKQLDVGLGEKQIRKHKRMMVSRTEGHCSRWWMKCGGCGV